MMMMVRQSRGLQLLLAPAVGRTGGRSRELRTDAIFAFADVAS